MFGGMFWVHQSEWWGVWVRGGDLEIKNVERWLRLIENMRGEGGGGL